MDIQEKAVYTKYGYLVPKHSKIPRKQFHELFLEYVKHPEHKAMLMKKVKDLSIKKGNLYKRTIKKSSKNKKSKKRRRN